MARTAVSSSRALGVGAIAPTPISGWAAGGAILVNEDDGLVRDGLRLMLERNGCRVLAAVSGADALEQIRANPRPLSLVLTDWRLAHGACAGDFLPSLLGKLATPVPLIILSGAQVRDVDTQVVASLAPLASWIRLLEKPLATDLLLAEIEQILVSSA